MGYQRRVHGYRYGFQRMEQKNDYNGTIRELKRAETREEIQISAPRAYRSVRGAWLPRSEVEWSRKGITYRYPGYIATTTGEAASKDFLMSPHDPEFTVPVMFIFHFDKTAGCDHENLLKDFS